MCRPRIASWRAKKYIAQTVERWLAQLQKQKDVMDDDRPGRKYLAAGTLPKRDRSPIAREKCSGASSATRS
jgi:hypothetical protein